MTLPQWAERGDGFWRRHYELATLTEDVIGKALETQCQKWLEELERLEGKAKEN